MLAMIAKGFLSGAEEDLNSKPFTKTASNYTSTLATMNKNLRESKYEYYFLGREEIYKYNKAVVRSMESLAQSLGGLRSAANTQFELLKEKSGGILSGLPTSPGANAQTPLFGRSISGPLKSGSRFAVLSAIDEAPDERSDKEDEPTPSEEQNPFDSDIMSPGSFRSPSDIFELFITRLGPSMKSLVHTLSEILREPPWDTPGSPGAVNENFKTSVADALSLFNSQRGKALEELYRTIELERLRPENVQADYEEVAAACGHFSFSLLSLGDEMQKYLDALDDLNYAVQQNRRSWHFLKFWKSINFRSRPPVEDPEQISLVKPIKPLRRSKLPKGIPDNMIGRRDTFSWDAAPQTNRIRKWVSQHLLKFFRFLSREDSR
jgi:hypothetical protein